MGLNHLWNPQEALLGDGVTCYWVYFMDPEGMLFELQEKN